MKKYLSFLISLLITNTLYSQVLFSEDFDSYPSGHLNPDYAGSTVGQGGWVIQRQAGFSATAMVTPESGKGNVLSMTTNGTFSNEFVYIFQDAGIIDTLWNNRTTSNNVLKLEYDIYGSGVFSAFGGLFSQGTTFMAMGLKAISVYRIGATHSGAGSSNYLKEYDAATFPYNTWIKAELFIDYNAQMAYYYTPTLNLVKADTIFFNPQPDNIVFFVESPRPTISEVKFDNIKLSALPAVPAYIEDALGINDYLSNKFNLYPNPATNVVNITNNENMVVKQVMVYDITGKLISIQSFNEQREIQLNIENWASGTYLLH